MIIKKIDFNDEKAIYLIKKYCLLSAPFGEIDHLNSISSREQSTIKYINELKKCDLSICCLSDEGDYLFFIFLYNLNNSCLDLEFALPNTANNPSTDLMRRCFYSLCLYGMDELNATEMIGTIRRQKKKNAYKVFLKRYIKAITYTENKDKKHDNVYLTKESILNHCEKLKAEGNWN